MSLHISSFTIESNLSLLCYFEKQERFSYRVFVDMSNEIEAVVVAGGVSMT